jgi:hypothetical protein
MPAYITTKRTTELSTLVAADHATLCTAEWAAYRASFESAEHAANWTTNCPAK